MTESTQHRRQVDGIPSLEIAQLIAAENDPKQRASLLVLHAISLLLESNTKMVVDIAMKLEKHLEVFSLHATEEQKLMNQGKGAWKIMAWVLAAVQALGIVLWNDVRSSQKESQIERAALRMDIQAVRVADNKIESRLNVLEQTK